MIIRAYLYFIFQWDVLFLAQAGIQLFGFHANLNKDIDLTEPGEIAGDITVDPTKPTNTISYFNPDIKLKVGDIIYYWIYIQHNYLGYRKEGQKWQVTGKILIKLSVHNNKHFTMYFPHLILERWYSCNKYIDSHF